MLLKSRLQEQSQKNNAKWEIIEQDYILSWALEGIASIPALKNNLVFKGGTALKKVYFGDYRFSQDLDFSVLNKENIESDLENLISQACQTAEYKIQELGNNVELKCERYTEKKPHPEGQQAFIIRARFPWQKEFLTTVYAEISFEEIILLPPQNKQIIHPYGEELEGKILVYPLEEVLAEKIRALLQFAKKLHERGWGRSRVRDYYDLWRIFKDYGKDLNLEILPNLVKQKCSRKNVIFNGVEDIFQEKLIANVDKEWDSWLSDVVRELPAKQAVIEDLRYFLKEIFGLTTT